MDIVGVDIGRNEVKYYSAGRKGKFKSLVGEWRERRLVNEYNASCYEVTVNSKRYFIADLAEESTNCRAMGTVNKIHEESRILFLSAIALVANPYKPIGIVTGLPIDQHTPDMKSALTHLLTGKHIVTILGKEIRFTIEQIAIAPEGCSSFWDVALDENGKVVDADLAQDTVKLIDIGSRTINLATIIQRRYLDRSSTTLPYGIGELITNIKKPSDDDKAAFTRKIVSEISWKWPDFDPMSDTLLLTGGGAIYLENWLLLHYPLARILPDPIYSNARGYYKMGRLKWLEK